MREQLRVNVPKAFLHPLFFNEDSQIVVESLNALHSLDSIKPNFLFLFDLLNAQGVGAYKPWKERKTTVPLLLDEWEKEKQILREFFGNRNRREARPLMIKGMALFIMALHWTNQEPVKSLVAWKREIEHLRYKPVNCIERVDYTLGAPDHYQSYIQLTELFEELLKQYHLSILKEKNSPRN